MVKTTRIKKRSRAEIQREQRSERWRQISKNTEELNKTRTEFLERVDVVILDSTKDARSYSAISDTRRGIIVRN